MSESGNEDLLNRASGKVKRSRLNDSQMITRRAFLGLLAIVSVMPWALVTPEASPVLLKVGGSRLLKKGDFLINERTSEIFLIGSIDDNQVFVTRGMSGSPARLLSINDIGVNNG